MSLLIAGFLFGLPGVVHQAMDSIGPRITYARPELRSGQALPGNGLSSTLLELARTKDFKPEFKDTTYIIGDTPNETLRVTNTWEWAGDVYIINDGVLLVQAGTLIVHGSVWAMDRGQFIVQGGLVRYPQMFTYQWQTVLVGDARMQASSATFDYGGFSYSLFVGDSASLQWDNLSMTKGFTTASVIAQDTVNISLNHVNLAGEWLFWGPVQAHFSHIDTMLCWFPYDSGVVVDITLPPWENMEHLVMADGQPGISGLEYSVVLDTISYCMWGTIIEPGSDVTFRDTRMRSIGIMGTGTDSQDVSGLVNGSTYSDFTLGMTDRNFHLVNTFVNTWSLYPSDTFMLTFDHCIVGEVLTMGNAVAWGDSYYLDGTGGHFEATGNSFNFAFGGSMTCEVYTSENGVGLLAAMGIPVAFGGIWARNSSRLILIKCQFPGKPMAYDSGLVWVMSVDEPFYAATESNVPLVGSATIIEGPQALYHFSHYNLYWAPESDTSVWHPIDNPHDQPVWKDTLAYWDTHGLDFGTYLIKLVMWDDSPDSLNVNNVVILNHEDTTGAVAETPQPARAQLLPGHGCVYVILPTAQDMELRVFDPAGRMVLEHKGVFDKGKHVFRMPDRAGVFTAILRTGDVASRTTVINLK